MTTDTDLDRRLLTLAAQGYTDGEIAWEIRQPRGAVKKAFARIYKHMGVRNRTEAVVLAYRRGDIPRDVRREAR